MLYTDLGALYVHNSTQHQSCLSNGHSHQNFYDVLVKTISISQQSMTPHPTRNEQETEQLSPKEKRAYYMSQLRGSNDSEYRRTERENNARAMRKKRLENPLYREHERRKNRAHMAEMRRDNPIYRQREHAKNRHRMALKRGLTNTTETTTTTSSTTINTDTNTTNNNNITSTITNTMVNSIYQTLENNLQSSHISFVPYQPSCSFKTIFDYHHQRRTHNNNTKIRNECEILQQVDDFCRQQQDTGSGSDSNSHGTASTSSC